MIKRKNGKEKPKYSIWQNVCFMLHIAWNTHKSVLIMCVLIAGVSVMLNLVELYITPEIISKIENGASIRELLAEIGLFTLFVFLLRGLKSYLQSR